MDKCLAQYTVTSFMNRFKIRGFRGIVLLILALAVAAYPDKTLAQATNWIIARFQTTNSIPPGLFVTDDGMVFSYRHGKMVVSVKKIEEARNSPECRPAEMDSEGNWGLETNGLMLSLRFSKLSYTNGEPITPIMLIRNMTTNPIVYYRPTFVVAMKDGKILENKNDAGRQEITMVPTVTLLPYTQQRYFENLNQVFCLTNAGEYIFWAACRSPEVYSGRVSVSIIQ